MDDQLIEQLISSDEMIQKNIEENNRMMTENFQDQFSSIMSMTSINNQNLEKELQFQGEKEAEMIKGNLTQNLSATANLNLEEIANATLREESSKLSDTTVNNLIQVISDLQDVINNLKFPTTTETIGTTQSQQTQIEGVDVANISTLIDDFKTLSNLTWCGDWLKCLEKVVEQADVVNKALSSIPDDKKINLGINDDSLQNVDQSIQKVKENISAEINLSAVKEEMASQAIPTETQLSTPFLNSFSDFNEKISSVVEKLDKNTISSESFVTKISEFSENTISTINTSFSEINKTNQEIIEKPFGAENTLQSLETNIKQIQTGVVENKPEPLSLKMVENVINVPPPPPLMFEGTPMAMPPIASQTPVVQPNAQMPIPLPPPFLMAFGEGNMAMPPIASQTPVIQPNAQMPIPLPPPLPMAFGEGNMAMPPIPPIATQMTTIQPNAQMPIPLPPPLPMGFGEGMMGMPPIASQTPMVQPNAQMTIPLPPPFPMAFSEGNMAMPPIPTTTANQQTTTQATQSVVQPPQERLISEMFAETQRTAIPIAAPFGMETFTLPLPERVITNRETFSNLVTNFTNVEGNRIQNAQTTMFEQLPFLDNLNQMNVENLTNQPQISTQAEMSVNPLNFGSLTNMMNNPTASIIQNLPTPIQTNQNLPLTQLQSLLSSTKQIEQPQERTLTRAEITTPVLPNIEEIMIKSQETEMPSLATAFSKIQTESAEKTSDMLANSQVMMNEINFEPLNKTFTSSISNLQDTIKSQKQEITPTTSTENISNTQSDTTTQMLTILTRLDETLNKISANPQQSMGVMPSLNSGMSDSQARMIGRQIASELKDNFAKLYI